jgi:glutaredoxin-like protein NrdH
MKNVIIYTADGCKFCEEAKAMLLTNNISFEERNIRQNKQYLQEAKDLGNRFLPIIRYEDTILVFPKPAELNAFIESCKQGKA